MNLKKYLLNGVLTLFLFATGYLTISLYGQDAPKEPQKQEQKAGETKKTDQEKASEFYKSGLDGLEQIRKLQVEKDILTEDKEKKSTLEEKIKELDKTTIQNFEAITGTDKDVLNAIIGLADTNYERNRYDKAIELYQKAVKKDDKNAELYFKIGFSLAELGKFDDALKEYEKAIKIDSTTIKFPKFVDKNAEKLEDEGAKLMQAKKYDAGIKKLIESLNAEKNPLTIYMLGVAHYFNTGSEYAISLIKQSIKIEPRELYSYAMLAKICTELNRPQNAILYDQISLLFEPSSKYKEEKLTRIKANEATISNK